MILSEHTDEGKRDLMCVFTPGSGFCRKSEHLSQDWWLMVPPGPTRTYLKAICGLQDRDLQIPHHYGELIYDCSRHEACFIKIWLA